jgi:hypothetical protein
MNIMKKIYSPLLLGLLLAPAFSFSVRAAEKEEFHQTFPLPSQGRFSLDNVNGDVRITGWDKAEVQIDAIKKAKSAEALEKIKIEIDAGKDQITVKTRYPKGKGGENGGSVEYTIFVPRGATLKKIADVNGSVFIKEVTGAVDVSTVNGKVVASGMSNGGEFESVNGSVQATFSEVKSEKSIDMKTVNGGLELKLPANANASVSASSLNGGIHSSYNLPVKKHFPIGSNLNADIGSGGAEVRMKSVNGGIQISQAK